MKRRLPLGAQPWLRNALAPPRVQACGEDAVARPRDDRHKDLYGRRRKRSSTGAMRCYGSVARSIGAFSPLRCLQTAQRMLLNGSSRTTEEITISRQLFTILMLFTGWLREPGRSSRRFWYSLRGIRH
jgi:hypothetical protein